MEHHFHIPLLLDKEGSIEEFWNSVNLVPELCNADLANEIDQNNLMQFGIPIDLLEKQQIEYLLPQRLSLKIYLINIGQVGPNFNEFPIFDGHCVLVSLPISEDKNEWALAKIEKEPLEDQYNFIIKLDQKIIFTGQNPQDTASQYMKYYEETNGKEILIDGYEIFGMYSLILWKIWQISEYI